MASEEELQILRDNLGRLTRRVYRLERAVKDAGLPLEEEAAMPPSTAPSPAVRVSTSPASTTAGGTADFASPSAFGGTIPAPEFSTFGGRPPRSQGLESQIGSQWLNRIGIAAVLIGVSFFLKWAFDNNWIGPSGRIAIGLLSGIAVVIWSERFRRRGFAAFSYSLKAVGIGVLYLSLWAAFQLYHLMPPEVAFGAMILVTAATAAMALQQDAQILAAFAIVGGFVTPVLVSTGENHEVALFSYIAVLDVATVVLAAVRPWRKLLFGAFTGTLILYLGWYISYYSELELAPTMVFATMFFVIFTAGTLLGARAESKHYEEGSPVRALILLLPLVNAAAYFFQTYAMLDRPHPDYVAWIAVALAAYFIAISRVQAEGTSELERRDLRLVHVALAIGFLTVAIPLKLNAHWITIGWLVEAAALFWVGRRLDSTLLRAMATGALVLGIVRLLIVDYFATHTIFFNMRFTTYLVAIAVLAMLARIGINSVTEKNQGVQATAVIAINVLALIALSYEISDAFTRAMVNARGQDWSNLHIAHDFSYSALWMLYGAGLMFVGFWKRSAFLRWQALVLIGFAVGKVFIYDMSELERVYRILSFIVLGVILLAISFAYQKDWLKLSARTNPLDGA